MGRDRARPHGPVKDARSFGSVGWTGRDGGGPLFSTVGAGEASQHVTWPAELRRAVWPGAGWRRRPGIQLSWQCGGEDPDEAWPGRSRPAEGRLAVLRILSLALMVDTHVAGMIRLDLEPVA
jgi:hypothetical protein